MLLLTRGLPVLLEIGLLVFCLVDCLQTPRERVRLFSRRVWVILIVLVPLAGGLAWIFAGRPRRGDDAEDGMPAVARPGAPASSSGLPTRPGARPPARRPRVVAPDDDPEFLARLARELAKPAPAPDKTAAPDEADGERDDADGKRDDERRP
ncbi:MAG: PLDc N-terminal domain-containing protein [Kineosporiaceae bacterium]